MGEVVHVWVFVGCVFFCFEGGWVVRGGVLWVLCGDEGLLVVGFVGWGVWVGV